MVARVPDLAQELELAVALVVAREAVLEQALVVVRELVVALAEELTAVWVRGPAVQLGQVQVLELEVVLVPVLLL